MPEDGVSSSLLEAMAVGVFPIVSDIKANRYWAEKGCSMIFFKESSADDLAKAISEYIANRHKYNEHLEKIEA